MIKQIMIELFRTLLILYIGILVGINMCRVNQEKNDHIDIKNNKEVMF